MPAIYEQYTHELRNKFGYLATWIPTTKLKLGDIGILKKDRFEYRGNLGLLGIEFSVRKSEQGLDLEYSSKKGVEISFKAAGDIPAAGQLLSKIDAGFSVKFKQANATIFIAQNCINEYIEDFEGLGKSIVEKYKEGRWEKDFVVISEVVNADSTTILISNSSDARADFKLTSKQSLNSLASLDLSADATITNSLGIDTKIIANGHLTPLFRASGLRQRLLSDTRFETRGVNSKPTIQRAGNPLQSLLFSDVDYDDFEN